MKTTIIILGLLLSACVAFANADFLRCRMIDWLDAPSNHNMEHYGSTTGWPLWYEYSGTENWDLAMGDSFMVWLPGTDRILFLDAYDSTDVDTIANFDYGSVDAVGVTICDSMIYLVGGGGAGLLIYRNDSLIVIDGIMTPLADYHFAALEDSFLYTISYGNITCINVADPESIYIYKTFDTSPANAGLEATGGYVYGAYATFESDSSTSWPLFCFDKSDLVTSTPPATIYNMAIHGRNLGDLASNDDYVFFVNSVMTDGPAWTIGESYLYVFGTDTSYNFDSRWDGQGVFGVDVIDIHLIAAGFEHGFSLLNISDLDSIYEVAYYIDPDSTMDFTHFVMKDTRIYAMAHPRSGYARLYMFDVGDSVATGQCEADELPEEFRFWNYPNPFNSSVKFAMDFMPDKIEIYDLSGRQVAEILDSRLHGNDSEYIWTPEGLPSGIYFARAKKGDISVTVKLVYLQ